MKCEYCNQSQSDVDMYSGSDMCVECWDRLEMDLQTESDKYTVIYEPLDLGSTGRATQD